MACRRLERPGFPKFVNHSQSQGRKENRQYALRDKTGAVMRVSVGPTFTKWFALLTHLTPLDASRMFLMD
jgi:hypothetical protein